MKRRDVSPKPPIGRLPHSSQPNRPIPMQFHEDRPFMEHRKFHEDRPFMEEARGELAKSLIAHPQTCLSPLRRRFLLNDRQIYPISPLFSSSRPAHDALRAHLSLRDPVSGSHRGSPRTTSCLHSPKNYPLPLTHTASFCRSRRVHKLDSTLRMRRAPSRRFGPKYPRVAS